MASVASLTVHFGLRWWVRPLLRLLNALAPIIRKSERLSRLVVQSIPVIARHGTFIRKVR